MLLIVGGAARSGKTLLARRLLETAQVPWFSLDMLRAGLTIGAPSLNLAFGHDDLDEADRLWPIVSAMFESMLAHETDYLVEGSCLRPAPVAALIRKWADSDVRAVFLGFPDLSAAAKRAQIDANEAGGNDWFTPLSEAEKAAHVDRLIRDSRRLREEAQAAGLPFIDTGADFLTGQTEAHRLMLP